MEVDKDGEIIRGDELINIDVKEIYVGEGIKQGYGRVLFNYFTIHIETLPIYPNILGFIITLLHYSEYSKL